MFRKTLSVLATSLVAGCATVADAGNLAEVAIVNRSTGERLPIYRHQGKSYIEGRAGDRYAVELRNRSGGRIMTVLSVDGVNAVSGESAAASQRGYVLDPHESAEIAGWRKSLRDVSAFYFTALPDSYAARTGRPDNVGVIGVAVFTEKTDPPFSVTIREVPEPKKQEADAALRSDVRQPGSKAVGDIGAAAAVPAIEQKMKAESANRLRAVPQEKLGTGHGERLHAPIQTTEFRRASNSPSEVITIYYDSRPNLIARGVIPRQAKSPQAFPKDCFVPDPS